MIYLDNAATTRPFADVLTEYTRISQANFANAGSTHYFGYQAKIILEEARRSILSDLGLGSNYRLLFTSGATEANNTVFKGIAARYGNRGKKILVGPTEHPSVATTASTLTKYGFEVITLPCDEDGKVQPETLRSYMDKQTILVSIMAVNNETGTVNDLKALAEVVHAFPKAFFHSDATQAVGKMKMDYQDVDLLSFSGHKFHGVKGSGALVYRSQIQFEPLHSGGAQENGFRAGTVDVAGAHALAYALHRCVASQAADLAKVGELAAYLREKLQQNSDIVINSPKDASPYVLDISFLRHKASVIVEALSEKEIYVSSIAACSTKNETISTVLEAMGKPKELCANSLRISFSPETTKEELDTFYDTLTAILGEVHVR